VRSFFHLQAVRAVVSVIAPLPFEDLKSAQWDQRLDEALINQLSTSAGKVTVYYYWNKSTKNSALQSQDLRYLTHDSK